MGRSKHKLIETYGTQTRKTSLYVKELKLVRLADNYVRVLKYKTKNFNLIISIVQYNTGDITVTIDDDTTYTNLLLRGSVEEALLLLTAYQKIGVLNIEHLDSVYDDKVVKALDQTLFYEKEICS